MSDRSFLRGLSYRLLRHTISVMPDDHCQWTDAMCAEVDYIENDGAAVRWAIGCLLTGYITRMNKMLNLTPDTRRKFLRTELLICFIPVTIWFISSFGYLLFTPDYAREFIKMLSITASAVGSIKTYLVMLSPLTGPLGLFLVLRLVLKQKRVSFWWPLLGLILCMPLANVVVSSVGRTISEGFFLIRWRDMVIFIFPMMLFPIAGFIQLFFLPRQDLEQALPGGMDKLSG